MRSSLFRRRTVLRSSLAIVFLGLTGCMKASLIAAKSASIGTITGSALMFATGNLFSVSSCNEAATVSLHLVDGSGAIAETPLTSATVMSDGSFTLYNTRGLGITVQSSNVGYVLKASACGLVYYRPLTGYTNQKLTYGSSMLALTSKVDDPSKYLLGNLNQSTVLSTLGVLDSLGATNMTDLVNTVIASTTLTSDFQTVTNVNPSKLKDLTPDTIAVTAPTAIAEATSNAYSVQVTSWNTDYVPAYAWKLNGSTVSTGSTYTLSTGKNWQGTYTLDLVVGSDDGSGGIDLTKPTETRSFPITVSNDYLPVAPSAALVGSYYSSTLPVQIAINTGPLLTNCDSFSTLALTEDFLSAPTSPTDYSITCTTTGTQTANFTLSSGDGAKTLALWARDSAGNVSASPSTVTVILDQANPTLSLGSVGSVLKGNTSTNVTWSASDVTSGIQNVLLEYSADGGSTYSTVTNLTSVTSPYTWTTPLSDVTGAKLRLTATDGAGNSSQVVSAAFDIDSTAPTITITSPSVNTASQTTATIIGACENGLVVNLSGDITPVTAVCNTGSYSQAVSFTGAGGVKNIVASQTDAAGNIGSTNRNLIKDTTAPAIAFISPPASTQARTGLIISGSCETGGSSITISGTGVSSTTTATCSSGSFSTSITFSATDGTKTVQISQTDSAGNTGSTTRDFVRNNTAPALVLTGPPDGTEAQTGVTLTGTCDASYTVDIGGTGTTSGGSSACSGGTFSIPITFTSGDGAKSVTVSQTDGIGNTATQTGSYVKDTVAPVVAISSPAANFANQTGITLTGTCETGLNVAISGDLSNPGNATCSSGGFAYSVTFTANDGTKNIVATQTDSAGNVGSANRDFVKDTQGPVAPTLTLLSNAISSSTAVSVGITCDADFAKVLYSTSSTTPLGSDPNWEACAATKSLTASTGDGLKKFYVFTMDAIGNIGSTPGSVSMTLDQTNPTVSLTSLNTSQVIKGGTSKNITWTASDTNLGSNPMSFYYSSNGGSTWTSIASAQTNSGSYAWTLPLMNSSNFKVKVVATDSAGNLTSAISATAFTVDSSAPVVVLNNLDGGELLKGGSTFSISWTATDTNFGSNPISIDYTTNNGSSWTSIIANTTNTGSYSWTVPLIDKPAVKVRITAVDLAGTSATATSPSPFIIDSTAPSLALTSLSGGQAVAGNGATTLITWVASDANFGSDPITLEYSNNSGGSWTTIASGIGNTGSYAWTVNVADGIHYRVRVKATDLLGWTTTVASTADFIVDSNAPNLTQTTISSPTVTTGNSVTFGGACDLSARMGSSTDITVSGAESATVSCSGSAPTGSWTWTTSTQSADAVRNYSFSQTSQTSLTTTVPASWVRQTVAPNVTATTVNDGDSYLHTLLASVSVTASDPTYSIGLKVRIASASGSGASCQALYSDDSWNDQVNATMTWATMVPDGDGVKKLCAWAKNAAGLVSVISPATGTAGVDMNTIQYANSSPPQVTSFSVTNPNDGTTTFASGDLVKISWTVTDTLGLDNNPITLEYTTDGTTWKTIESAYGGLSSNPTSYSYDYYGFNAPTGGFTRVRIKAKNVTGQYSNTILSQALNGGRWLVYAGNKDRGVGGTATTAMLYKNYNVNASYVINPKTNDMYVVDELTGVLKIDGKTGLTSTFLVHGTTNLVDGGVITPGVTKVSTGYFSMAFDSNGYLYLNAFGGGQINTNSFIIWQIDLSTNVARKYLTGGTSGTKFDNSATPSTVYVGPGQIAFDESNTMYFVTSCTPGAWDDQSTAANMRLMKVTQVNGNADTVSIVAGNCVNGAPVSGTAATATGFGIYNTSLYIHSLAVWNNGGVIYYTLGAGGEKPYKILNGVSYSTALPTISASVRTDGFLTYNPKNGKLYRAASQVEEWTPSLSGANGETSTVFAASNGTGGCTADGVSASSACVVACSTIGTTPQGKVIFTDNVTTYGGSIARVRYVDDQGIMRTLAGAKGHYGEGLDKSLARTSFAGIYYKKASEPNQTAFPEGLYFRSWSGAVLGRIGTDGIMTTVWGNQLGNPLTSSYPAGTTVSTNLSMGITDDGSSYKFLAFDTDGLPWFGYMKYLTSLDSNLKTVTRMTSSSSSKQWDYVSAGTAATAASFYAGSPGQQNLVLKGTSGVFLYGRTYDLPGFTSVDPMVRFFDYSLDLIDQIMGGNGSTTMSADSTTTGSVASFNFGPTCINDACAIQYDGTNDVLYFSDGAVFRSLASPNTPASNYLTTIFTASSNIQNFILSLDSSQVYYTRSGKLYCHALTAGGVKTWCNDTSLGPTTGLSTITKGPNQFTWKDSQTLLVNTYSAPAEIYEFDLPTIP